MTINQLHLKAANHLGFVLSLVKQGDEIDDKNRHKDTDTRTRKSMWTLCTASVLFFCICFLKTRNPWFLHCEALG